MDFAAAAVLDPIAPPTARPGLARSASEAPTFEQHLETEQREPDQADAKTASETASPEEALSPAASTPVLIVAAPQVIVQLAEPAPAQLAAAAPPLEQAALAPAQMSAPGTASGLAPAPTQTTPAPVAAKPEQLQQAASEPKTAPISSASPGAAQTPRLAELTQSPPQAPQPQGPPSPEALAALQAMAPAPKQSRTSKADTARTPETSTPINPEIAPQRPQRFDSGKPQAKSAPALARVVASQSATALEAPALVQAEAPLAQAATSSAQPTTEATRAAPVAAQIWREIIRRFNGQSTQFELRLDPPELGRVEVRLEVSRDHRVTATIAADNPQALAELARHARELEQSLQAAGLELAENGLSFDLRQGGESAREARKERSDGAAPADEAMPAQVLRSRPIGFERWRGVRVDVMA